MLRIIFLCCVLFRFTTLWRPPTGPLPMGLIKGHLHPYVVVLGLESACKNYSNVEREEFKKSYINDIFKMGGTVVNPYYVLTNAHVFVEHNITETVTDNVTDWVLFGAGSNFIPVPSRDTKVSSIKMQPVNRIILHPNYEYVENKTLDIYNLALAVFFTQIRGIEITRSLDVKFSSDFDTYPMQFQTHSDIKMIFWVVSGNYSMLRKYYLILDLRRPCRGVTKEGLYCFWPRICGEARSPCAPGTVAQGTPIIANNEMQALFTGYKDIGCHIDLGRPLTGIAVLDLIEKLAADPNLHVASDFMRFYIGRVEEYTDIINQTSSLVWSTEKPIPLCVKDKMGNKGTRARFGLLPMAVLCVSLVLAFVFDVIC